MSDAPDSVVPDAADAAGLQRLAAEYDVPFVARITDDMLDPALVSDLPVDWARSHAMLPGRYDGSCCILTDTPHRVAEQESLAMLVNQDLSPVVAPRAEILRAITRCYYQRDDSPSDFMQQLEPESPARAAAAADADLLQADDQAPVSKLVNLILLEAVKQEASDVHFEPHAKRLRVRYRIDGVLYEQSAPPKHLEDALISRLKVMAHLDIAEKRLPQDGTARVSVGEREIDLRVSTVPVADGERVVLRVLDRASSLLPLDALGMSGALEEGYRELLARPNGLVVVCGPTGSGKTTTLYASLGQLDASRKNILTVEDPVEYQIEDIGQIQVNPKIGLTFATGLRHILRQDPDIVLVGEIRDRETADIAVRASLTGHLVFSTVHTNDAPASVLRLVDIGVEPYLLASCLEGVLAQRLVRRLCGTCRRETVASEAQAERMGVAPEELAGRTVWDAVGCDACLEGYSGRVGLFELLRAGEVLRDAVMGDDFCEQDIRAAGVRAGMQPLERDALQKILSGATSLSEVLAVL